MASGFPQSSPSGTARQAMSSAASGFVWKTARSFLLAVNLWTSMPGMPPLSGLTHILWAALAACLRTVCLASPLSSPASSAASSPAGLNPGLSALGLGGLPPPVLFRGLPLFPPRTSCIFDIVVVRISPGCALCAMAAMITSAAADAAFWPSGCLRVRSSSPALSGSPSRSRSIAAPMFDAAP